MAKRDTEIEPVDEELVEPGVPTVGEQLRVAREEKGISLEDVAAQTRIPQRHLVSIETGDWDSLPAPTYTIGFAKSYATVVGLDRVEIGIQLREEMGGQRFASTSADVFEPADPARTMPKALVIGAIIAVVVLVILMSWLNRRSLAQNDQSEQAAVTAPTATTPSTQPQAVSQTAAAQGPVVLTATAPAWIEISDQGKSLFQGELQPGQSYTVPATATAPMLKAGKPESLKITVGSATVAQVGPPGRVTTVSLAPADLMKTPPAQAPAAQPAPAAPAPRRSQARAPRSGAPDRAAPVETQPPTNTAE
jgi:cytoskeleton protein RodZ